MPYVCFKRLQQLYKVANSTDISNKVNVHTYYAVVRIYVMISHHWRISPIPKQVAAMLIVQASALGKALDQAN